MHLWVLNKFTKEKKGEGEKEGETKEEDVFGGSRT